MEGAVGELVHGVDFFVQFGYQEIVYARGVLSFSFPSLSSVSLNYGKRKKDAASGFFEV